MTKTFWPVRRQRTDTDRLKDSLSHTKYFLGNFCLKTEVFPTILVFWNRKPLFRWLQQSSYDSFPPSLFPKPDPVLAPTASCPLPPAWSSCDIMGVIFRFANSAPKAASFWKASPQWSWDGSFDSPFRALTTWVRPPRLSECPPPFHRRRYWGPKRSRCLSQITQLWNPNS